MKRLLAILLTIALALGLCGCDLSFLLEQKETPAPTEKTQENTPNTEEKEEILPPERPDVITVTKEQMQAVTDEFMVLVNQERVEKGLAPLVRGEVLNTFARSRAEELLIQFSHTRPDGTPWNDIMLYDFYRYDALGENIVMTSHVGDSTYSPEWDFWTGSPAQISAAAYWMFKLFKESPEHYANMISPEFEDCGIGITYVMDETESIPIFYLAHIFGSTE